MNTNEHGYLRMLASALRGRNYAHNIPLLRIRGSWWRCTFRGGGRGGGGKTVSAAALKNPSSGGDKSEDGWVWGTSVLK